MIDQVTFNQWMNDFFQSKFNQLSYSNTRYPKRVEKVTLNLATAPTQPIKISVPFKSVLVSRVYSTSATTVDKSGSVKILFDYDNLMNIQNAVSLFPNDSFDMDTEAAQAFLTWDAQSDTSIDLFFFVDIAFRAGTTKTQIVGTVSVQNSSGTPFYNKAPTPNSIHRYYKNSTGTVTYTIPAGYWAKVYWMNQALSTDGAKIDVNGTIIADSYGNSATIHSTATGITECVAGDVITGTITGAAGYCVVAFQVALYPL